MKIVITEHDGCFAFDLAAEDMVDAALLTRLGMNGTRAVRSINTFVDADGSFTGSVVIGKHGRSNSAVPNRAGRKGGRK